MSCVTDVLAKLTISIIPITESMKQPQKLPGILSGVMLFVAILFAGFGVLGYGAYGKDIQTVVIVNLPQDDKFVQAVQFLCKSHWCTGPTTLTTRLYRHPPVNPTSAIPRCPNHGERSVFEIRKTQPFGEMAEEPFPRRDRAWVLVDLMGRVVRAGQVCLINRLVCLVSRKIPPCAQSSTFSVPLCFIYPPLLHLRACAKSRMAKIGDYVFIAFGIGVGLFTTIQTLRSFAEGGGDAPKFGKCDIPT